MTQSKYADVRADERALIQRLCDHTGMIVTDVARRSDLEYDLSLKGTSPGYGGCAFSGWLPLMAIHDLTRWTDHAVADMTDHPEMARDGDWSAIRDTSVRKTWAIFDRFVRQQVRSRQK